jgi:hypothetical protein
VKVQGDDLDQIRGLAEDLRGRFAAIPGIADLQIEKQVRIPSCGWCWTIRPWRPMAWRRPRCSAWWRAWWAASGWARWWTGRGASTW